MKKVLFVGRGSRLKFGALAAAALLAVSASASQAALTHRYSFTTGMSDSVGGATFNGSLVNSATVSGGALQFNNPNFTGGKNPDTNGYATLPISILPTSGSVTIEEWFTITGSGFFAESYTFSDNANDTNNPGANNGQYLVHAISCPQGGATPAGGGNRIEQAQAGGFSTETDDYGSTVGVGAGGGGFMDDGETFMCATVIDASAGLMSYYMFDMSQGGIGGLQSTVAADPLSGYSFTNAYLGRSAFIQDDATSGSMDEFRIYNSAQTAGQVAIDASAGPNVVVTPEPASLSILALGGLAMAGRRRRRA
jgi:hypothetical protein